MSDKKEEMTFEIRWCQLCGTNMVICPKCGNNCCKYVLDDMGFWRY